MMGRATSHPSGDPSRQRAIFVEHVRSPLTHLHDPTVLETHPLACRLPPGPPGTTASPGRALRREILAAIESLRPDAEVPAEAHAQWTYQRISLTLGQTRGQSHAQLAG